ncbi:MAG: hypothetical protein ACI4HQ_09295 [Acetatifactor sp.]
MNNRKFYSYERNNYYYGKLLTSRDFQVEQSYLNDKRRLTNRLCYGNGIVSGLKIVEADDTSIILQSGCAIDGAGREIVVPETVVVKLATIEGSRNLQTDVAYLSIAYTETREDKVYAVMGNVRDEKSEDCEYNHIKEGYQLSLQDAADCVPVREPKDDYLIRTVLYEDEDYRIVQEVAGYLPTDCNLAVKLAVYKKRQSPELLSVRYTVSVEGIKEQSFPIQLDNLKMDRYETRTITETIVPKAEVRYLADFKLRMEKLEVLKNKQKCQVQEPAPVTVTMTDRNLVSLIVDNSYKTAMDVEIEENYDNKIYLAKLYLIRSNEHILLDHIEEVPFKQYVYSTSQLMLLEELKDYYPRIGEAGREVRIVPGEVQRAEAPEQTWKQRDFVTGAFDLSIGNAGETGKTYYSEEIMHGLGEGPVYVEIAYEILNKEKGNLKEEIVFGDGELFAAGEAEEKQMQISYGVKVLPERGTFIVAVRPKNKTMRTSLRIRWYACKAEDTGKNISRLKEKQGMILISPDTITTTPKGIVQIQPKFVNMAQEACSYEVLDQAGGKIDNNGIYTAPTAEGVYEVKVSCISAPEIFAHAYIIVSAEKK